ncbi:MAG: RNA pseudouridine synthase [Paracoccaceae bacterium]|nr:MAG: RNA pseudouridine synthase [Paracoccaceae bacterium]
MAEPESNLVPGAAYRPPEEPLRVLHADRHVLVVVKPAGLLSVPGRGPHLADSLATRAAALFPGARIVHRLDRDTSGLLVLGLTVKAHRALSIQFQERRVGKAYAALVAGHPARDRGRVDLPLAYDEANKPRQRVDPAGRPALTEWQVIARLDGHARMRLVPVTGRSHQLRVHMLALGHPILGDPLYGNAPAPRLMLHAEELAFAHPAHGRAMRFRDPAPF